MLLEKIVAECCCTCGTNLVAGILLHKKFVAGTLLHKNVVVGRDCFRNFSSRSSYPHVIILGGRAGLFCSSCLNKLSVTVTVILNLDLK
jgi:hypothetical protein